MQRLLTKSYNLELIIEKKFFMFSYNKKIKLFFEQAKIIDTIEFYKIINEGEMGIIIWLLKFISDHTSSKLKQDDKMYIMQYREKIFNKIKNTFFEGCFQKEKSDDESPYSSYLAILSEKIGVDPLRLVKEYTPMQLEFLSEGIVRNINALTKEGQRKNKLFAIQQKGMNRSEEQQKKIQEILNSIRNGDATGTN